MVEKNPDMWARAERGWKNVHLFNSWVLSADAFTGVRTPALSWASAKN